MTKDQRIWKRKVSFTWEMSTSIHWIYFLYFTVHAHEDRPGTGVLYQREWGKDYGPLESYPQGGYSLNKNMGSVLEKYFPKPPDKVKKRIYIETAVHWNTRIALSNIDHESVGVYGVSDDCANRLAVKFNRSVEILLEIFKAFVKTIESDNRILIGEQMMLSKIAEIWKIEKPQSYYSDNVKFIEPPKLKGCKRYEGGIPICPKCGDFMEQLSRYNRFDFNKEYYEQLQNPIDKEPWSCGGCAFAVK